MSLDLIANCYMLIETLLINVLITSRTLKNFEIAVWLVDKNLISEHLYLTVGTALDHEVAYFLVRNKVFLKYCFVAVFDWTFY